MNAALGHRIVEQLLAAHDARHRTGHQDGASLPQMRDGGLHHVEITVEVGFQCAVELGIADVLDALDMLLKGSVVDENIESAKGFDGFRYSIAAIGGIG